MWAVSLTKEYAGITEHAGIPFVSGIAVESAEVHLGLVNHINELGEQVKLDVSPTGATLYRFTADKLVNITLQVLRDSDFDCKLTFRSDAVVNYRFKTHDNYLRLWLYFDIQEPSFSSSTVRIAQALKPRLSVEIVYVGSWQELLPLWIAKE